MKKKVGGNLTLMRIFSYSDAILLDVSRSKLDRTNLISGCRIQSSPEEHCKQPR